MILHQDNKIIEFTIDGYEYMEKTGSTEEFNYDANCLMCKIKYSDENCCEIYRDPCLLTSELAEMEREVAKAIDGVNSCYISDYMESRLNFAVAKVQGKIVMLLSFTYEVNDDWKHREVAALLSVEEALIVREDLGTLVSRYPER